jgi:hypothetical protein
LLTSAASVGSLKALIVHATLTSGAEAARRPQIAFRTVLVATIAAVLLPFGS